MKYLERYNLLSPIAFAVALVLIFGWFAAYVYFYKAYENAIRANVEESLLINRISEQQIRAFDAAKKHK